jgi:gamma-glutamyltranspeptidase/glutathione hydrolase
MPRSFDWSLPFPSRRVPVFARHLVATSQPLAVEAGLRALADGGNAVDAALAAAITLVVVEPNNNGVGGDAFALVWDGERLHGLNASGRSPAAFTREHFEDRQAMPSLGWDTVTVPGAVSAWVELSRRFGRLPFEPLFNAATDYARHGYLVSPTIAAQWEMVAGLYGASEDFRAAFLPNGRAPAPGERFSLPALADTLEEIATTKGESFYRGALAERIAAHARACGGALAYADLAAHAAEWVEPLSTTFAGLTVHELPPNTQGIAALVALGILEHLGIDAASVETSAGLHLQIEAMKVGLADAASCVGDPSTCAEAVRALLAQERLAAQAAAIKDSPARCLGTPPSRGDTVYLTAADAGGMMVSYIQSNYFSFGSGIVVPSTGISLHNRGACFSLEKGHPNRIGPGLRPFHTLIPAFITKDGAPLASFGVMGGPMQAQGHVQLLARMLADGRNPQAALDAPRWQVLEGRAVGIESGFPATLLNELEARGHELRVLDPTLFGGAQMIWRLDGGYAGASDPRKDGMAAGF